MKLEDIGITEQIFTHIDEEGVVRVIAIERLKDYLEKEHAYCKMSKKEYEHLRLIKPDCTLTNYLIVNGGFEPERLARIRPKYIDKHPIILLVIGDQQLLGDGCHRYVAAYRWKRVFIPAYFVPEEVWKRYMLDDVSEYMARKVLTMPSGI